jgi:antitoxin ParD1/3/4
MPTVNISLPESLRRFVTDKVEQGGYGSVSEYMRSLIREAREREAEQRLESALLEGLASGPSKAVTPAFWAKRRAAVKKGGRKASK